MPKDTTIPDNPREQFDIEFLKSIHNSAQEETTGFNLRKEIPEEGPLFQKRKTDHLSENGNVYADAQEVYECRYCRRVIQSLAKDKFEEGRWSSDPFLRECKHQRLLFIWLAHLLLWWLWNMHKQDRGNPPKRVCGLRVCQRCYRLTDSGRGYCPDHARLVLLPTPTSSDPLHQTPKNLSLRACWWHQIARGCRFAGRVLSSVGKGIISFIGWFIRER